MEFTVNDIAKGLLMSAACAIMGVLGYLTAQKVDEISREREDRIGSGD